MTVMFQACAVFNSVGKPFHNVGQLAKKLRSPSASSFSEPGVCFPLQSADANTRCVTTPAEPPQQGTVGPDCAGTYRSQHRPGTRCVLSLEANGAHVKPEPCGQTLVPTPVMSRTAAF